MAINYPTCVWNLTDSYILYLQNRFNISPDQAINSITSINCAERSYDYLSDSFVTALIAIYCVIMPLEFFGNLIVIVIVGINKNLRNPTNILLIGVCVSDLLLTLSLPWTLIHDISYSYTLGRVTCKTIPTIQGIDILISRPLGCRLMTFKFLGTVVFSVIFTLVMIATERYHAIAFPTKQRIITSNKLAGAILGIIWTGTLLFNVKLKL